MRTMSWLQTDFDAPVNALTILHGPFPGKVTPSISQTFVNPLCFCFAPGAMVYSSLHYIASSLDGSYYRFSVVLTSQMFEYVPVI
jgi:hypothetical protein